MNESRQFKSNPSKWSARERWVLCGISWFLGAIWGGVGMAISALLASDVSGIRFPDTLSTFAVVIGMALGTGHASQFWLARSYRRVSSNFSHELWTYATVCIGLGILWGSVLICIYMAGVTFIDRTFSNFVGIISLVFIFGTLLGFRSVLPAAIIMALPTILIWRKILEHLESQRLSSKNS